MGINLIYGSEATLEDLYRLNKTLGIEFTVGDGEVTEVTC